ncbi:hypothetical protein G7074_23485 [Pedobacter sp. HDW13]|uniref:DUF6580 family putative transport protein n=1 Tax=unclassified Pedobacter TaxID=2628915 RepID=UPI000F59D12A|nr:MULTISPECIES: DUF6580 family putative transport protein [unclassified Pedobacter]QIL41968.1 hypothetical protein G7074_23485 [Pedobacter sp. HDW13]RQO68550.1 hypothetical protein DBR40_20125 [Pedobacter sp. KBW01]
MSHLKFNPRTLILLLMILVITAFRLLVTFNSDELKFANFSSIGAVALFGGAYFKDHAKAFAFPLLSLFLSDFILASTIFSKYSGGSFLYQGWYWTYIAFALMVLVGRILLKNVNVVNLLASTLTIVLIHWLVTDLGVWINNPAYTQDLAGYWNCLVKAIPFEIRFLEGTVIYGALLFGAFEILKAKYPVLKLEAQAA